MAMTVDELYTAAVMLPNESKAILADKLVKSIENDIDVSLTQTHLEIVRRRRDDIRSGLVKAVDGEKALASVRASLHL